MSDPKLVYCDNHLLVLVKPAGWPVVPDASGDPSLLEWGREWIRQEFHKPGNVFLGVVHRLDRPVSGLVVFGRTSKGAARLNAAWAEHRVTKLYHGWSRRPWPEAAAAEGVVEHSLIKDPDRNRVRVVAADTSGARLARSRWRLLESSPSGCRLELEALTGRSHQLRVACAELGVPLAGDLKYGAGEPMAGRRIGLHACRLAFPHPTRAERMEFADAPSF